MKRVYVVGTADTKAEELLYLRARLASDGIPVATVDVGTRAAAATFDVVASEVAAYHPEGADAVLGTSDRGEAVSAMSAAFARFVADRDDIAGVLGIGGGGGTAIVSAGMRALPLGVPKLVVSTLASGDVAPYVDVSDIAMLPAVTDFAGLNSVSRVILANAAAAMAGMVRRAAVEGSDKPAIGLTMFGVTTPCVTEIVGRLRSGFDCLVFHATGTGGRTMEKLVDSGLIAGVIDITTTEVADLLVGGVLSAGEDRLGAIARTGVPYVGSVGALDMVNFWARETVPERFRGRRLHVHNQNVTLMRTTAEECRTIGRWIAERLNAMDGPVRFLIPEKGVSALDREGSPFFDRRADEALFGALAETFRASDRRRLIRLPLHVNDPAFAAAAADAFLEIVRPPS